MNTFAHLHVRLHGLCCKYTHDRLHAHSALQLLIIVIHGKEIESTLKARYKHAASISSTLQVDSSSLQPHCKDVASTFQAHCKRIASKLQAPCKHIENLKANCKHSANTLKANCKYIASTLQANYKHSAITLKANYKHSAIILQAQCKHIASTSLSDS